MSVREKDTAVEILAPLEQDGTEAVLRAWLRAVGDRVAEGDALAELETDKVAVEVQAPATGVLGEILIEPDKAVSPGAVLGRILSGAEAGSGETVEPPPPPGEPGKPAPGPAAGSIADFDPALRLSPSVRKLLLETGLDPVRLEGSGKDGRLTRADVAAAAEAREPEAPAGTPAPPHPVRERSVPDGAPPIPEGGPLAGRRMPHDLMRRRIAEHMARSVSLAPHVTAVFEADLGPIVEHRAANRQTFADSGAPLTLTAYFVAAAVEAMRRVPAINSRWHDDFLEVYDDINIGVGTAMEDGKGLVVPVVHKAQDLSLQGIAQRLHAMTGKARAGRLARDDVRGGTFTISNHGVSGSLLASPIIINQPQSAILGIGKLEKRVVVREIAGSDAMIIRPMAYITLTIDHRVVDGAQANAWLARFVEVLENWR